VRLGMAPNTVPSIMVEESPKANDKSFYHRDRNEVRRGHRESQIHCSDGRSLIRLSCFDQADDTFFGLLVGVTGWAVSRSLQRLKPPLRVHGYAGTEVPAS
jgi:hypothetical protein